MSKRDRLMPAARRYNRGVSTRNDRIADLLETLARLYPKPKIALEFRSPFELLIATILAAQSTDVRVNLVTRTLFTKYPRVADFAEAAPIRLERDVHSTGFFRNKAKAIIAASTALLERHGGEVPETMEELVALPGVGRKTANVVLGNALGKNAGIVVDTHVGRVATRLGLTENRDPVKIESDLMKLIPQKEWTRFALRLIQHGRAVCVARKPKCSECLLNPNCPSAETALE